MVLAPRAVDGIVVVGTAARGGMEPQEYRRRCAVGWPALRTVPNGWPRRAGFDLALMWRPQAVPASQRAPAGRSVSASLGSPPRGPRHQLDPLPAAGHRGRVDRQAVSRCFAIAAEPVVPAPTGCELPRSGPVMACRCTTVPLPARPTPTAKPQMANRQNCANPQSRRSPLITVPRPNRSRPVGDWSIFRRESVSCESAPGREHGPVPFRGSATRLRLTPVGQFSEEIPPDRVICKIA